MTMEEAIKTAIDYEKRILNFFKNNIYPSFDLILLGIGNDGHTASLFPENKVLNETKKLVSSVKGKKINQKRRNIS